MPSGGLTKGLYARHHCWALNGFKLGGLIYLSLLLRVLYIYIHTYIYVCVCVEERITTLIKNKNTV